MSSRRLAAPRSTCKAEPSCLSLHVLYKVPYNNREPELFYSGNAENFLNLGETLATSIFFFYNLPSLFFFFSPLFYNHGNMQLRCMLNYIPLNLLFLFHIAKVEESQKLFLEVQNHE